MHIKTHTHTHTYSLIYNIHTTHAVFNSHFNASVVPAQLRAFVGDDVKAKDLGFMVAGGGCECNV